jgi:predicted 3-demethylubiquinone-9 3-methyltransferase (glyoxalase superfamily)
MARVQQIVPCLWFDDQAEEAARYYTGIFKNSKIGTISRYTEAGHDVHGRPAGSVMVVEFEIEGQRFTALNGGPLFTFNEAVSLQIECGTQQEADYYWDRLTKGGDEKAQQCGWLKDKYGLSWQIVPKFMAEMMSDPDPEKAGRVMEALLRMKKLDFEELQRAFEGTAGVGARGGR